MRSLDLCALLFWIVAGTPTLAGAGGGGGEVPRLPEKRIPWNDSRVVGSPDPPLPYKTVRAFPRLSIRQPLALAPEPGTDRLFVLQHLGVWSGPSRLLAVRDDPEADALDTLLDIDALAFGFAFHPDYAHNGYLFIGLNGPMNGPKSTGVVRYTVDRKTGRIDPATKVSVIAWPSDGHNGGDLAFGNDGTLFISAGDGSSGSDAHETGQTVDDLRGAVLRIDVDHPDAGRAYSVPRDNPFVGRPGARPELWAYGLRNPWRLSYDRESGQLWVGNNGQDLWEQVYLIKKGGNYGWSLFEGSHIFLENRPAGPDPILLPAAEHSHSEARSLTGGRVYRGKRLPELVGAYVYGDWSTGRVWGIRHDGQKALWHRELVDTPFNITGFGTDHSGELYVIDHAGGFYRLEPISDIDRPKQPFPTRLSETGLFTSVAAHAPHRAAIGYGVVAPQWADGASMERFAAFPGLDRIVQHPQLNAGGAWTLPNGSVLVQTLSIERLDDAGRAARRRIETRLLVRQQGEWTGYSYRWNPEQTDATLVPASGGSEDLEVPDPGAADGRREQSWRFPARTECLVCHSRAAGFVLGFSPLQLDRDCRQGEKTVNQLRAFEGLGVFQGELPKQSANRPRLVDPYDAHQPPEARVRSYLHVNCSVCHVQEGGGNSLMQLDVATPTRRMNVVDAKPVHDALGLPDARLIAPGAPERSVLFHRISRRDTRKMPPLGSNEVDREAVRFIGEWIRGLPANGGASRR
ncbi:MAG: PQQ-dependent sugar dehydrogenase [Isosphaeraceae bacterium]